MTIYMKIKQTSMQNAIDMINLILIEAKTSARVSKNNMLITENIPYDYISTFKYYMYHFKIEISDKEYHNLQQICRRENIGISQKPDDNAVLSVKLLNAAHLGNLLAQEYNLDLKKADSIVNLIFDTIFEEPDHYITET